MKLHETLERQLEEFLPKELANHPEIAKFLGAINATYHEHESNLMSLINDMLDYSQFDAGKIHLERTIFSPRSAIEQTCQVVAERAQAKNIELIGFSDPGIPELLIGDPSRVHQILLNVLSIAVKFTEHGEITVKAIQGKSTPGSKHRYWLTFIVKDSGTGIPKSDIKRIFQPFEQADSTTTRKYGSTGLGLALCKQFTNAMDGNIDIKSRPGKGSEFRVTIPFRTTENKQLPLWKSSPLPAKRLLLITDNRSSSDALETLLEDWGLSIYSVAKANNAIRILTKGHFDGVILDRSIRDANTNNIIHDIHQIDKIPNNFPILLLVNLIEKHALEEFPEPCIDYVTKPIESNALYQRLHDLFVANKSANALSQSKTRPTNTWKPPRELKILVTEDDLVNQEIAAIMLKDLHCSVDIARNGLEAIAAIKRMNYDLVFMDCQMPEMDGYTATEAIREQGFSDIPIVALTANVMAEDKAKCLQSGMNDYLSKPVKPAALRTILQRWISASEFVQTAEKPITDATIEALENLEEMPEMMPGINLKQGLDMTGGKLSRYRKLLYLAIEQHRYTYDKIKTAVERGDYQEAQQLAHSLKSVAANIGAQPLSSVAFKLEKQLKDPKNSEKLPTPLLQELDLQWKQVCSSILSLSKDARKQ